MKGIKNLTPHFYGYDNYPRDEEGKILLDRADDGRIVIKRTNTLSFGSGLLALCNGAKISEEDWKDLRRGFYLEESNGTRKYHYCIGGSDAGAVAGKSSYTTAYEIYEAKKFGKDKEISDQTEYMFKYGHLNEALIAEGFATRTKLTVYKNDCVFFNTSTCFMQANVDYFVKVPNSKNKVYILEIKTTSPDSTIYQMSKEEKVPPTYYAQAVLHYPLVLSPAFNIVGTFFAIGCDNNIDRLNFCFFGRDEVGEKNLLEIEKEFADRLVNDNPPKDTSTPEQRLEKSGLKTTVAQPIAVELSPSAKSAAAELLAIKAQIQPLKKQLDEYNKRCDELQAILCEDLGEAASSTPFPIKGKKYTISYNSFTKESYDKTVLKCKYPDISLDPDVHKKSTYRKFSMKENKEVKK